MAGTKAHTRYRLKPTKDFKKGEIVPGVTTITRQLGWNSEILFNWAVREALKGNDPRKMRDSAADSGTYAHYLIECDIKGVEPDKEYTSQFTGEQIDKGETGFLAFLEWSQDNKLEYYKSEYTVISEIYRYGGQLDILAYKNGLLWLLDIKTASGIYAEHKIQQAAYKMAYQEQENKTIDECHILQLNKEDGSFQHHKISNQQIEAGWEVFKYCRALYDLQRRF